MSEQTPSPIKLVKTPKTRNRLEQLVGRHATATGQAQNRLRNWVSFMVFACVEIFAGRKKHSWPPELSAEPGWRERFSDAAREIGFAIEDLDDAIAEVRAFIAEIDAANGT